MLVAAWGAGRAVVRLCVRLPVAGWEGVVWCAACGLLAAGLICGLLGLAGILYAVPVRILTLAGTFWALAELAQARLARADQRLIREGVEGATTTLAVACAGADGIQSHEDDEQRLPAWTRVPAWLRRWLVLLSIAAGLGALASALAPPTAGDALCYHLDLPKRFLQAHALVVPAYNENATYPLLTELLYTWAMALDGPVCAQLVHWAMGVLLAAASAVLARPLVGGAWAQVAGCLVLLVPAVTNQMTAPLNDLSLALWCTLALAAWQHALAAEEPRWFGLAGLMAGAAASTKYLALIFLPALALPWLWHCARRRDTRRTLLVGAEACLAAAAGISGIWFVRAAWQHGNPVYPFFDEWFNSAAQQTLPSHKAALGKSLAALATAPWLVTMQPESYGGRGHQLGPLWLAVLPALVCCRRLRGLYTLLAVALFYLLAWFCLRQNVRFLLPVLPIGAVAAVWVLAESRRWPSWPRRAALGAVMAIAIGQAALPLKRALPQLPVALGLESREQYLLRCEPTFGMALRSNALLPRAARVLSQELRALYFDAEMVRESVFRRKTRYHERLTSPDDLARALRSAGYTHLLLAQGEGPGAIHYNPTLSRLVSAAQQAGAADTLHCLAEEVFADVNGSRRRYKLIELRAPKQHLSLRIAGKVVIAVPPPARGAARPSVLAGGRLLPSRPAAASGRPLYYRRLSLRLFATLGRAASW